MAKGKRPHVEKNAKNGKKTDLIADKDTEIGEKQNGDEAVEDSDDGDTSDSSVYSGLGSDEDESDSEEEESDIDEVMKEGDVNVTEDAEGNLDVTEGNENGEGENQVNLDTHDSKTSCYKY